MDNKQELELLDGFRRLCPTDRNTVMTAVSMAVSAEAAVRREIGFLVTESAKNAQKARQTEEVQV